MVFRMPQLWHDDIVYVAHGCGFKWFDRLAFRREAEQGSRYDEFVSLSMLENC